jgi:hypothetical protein
LRKVKKLTIEERVDRLLKEGVNNPKKWMSIHGYKEPDISKMDMGMWYDEWKKLREHHLEETAVLFDIIRELTKRMGP